MMEAINVSIDVDRKLYAQDIAGSKAHAEMLVAQGILSPADGAAIADGLDRIKIEIETGVFPFSRAREDIHMNIEGRLSDLIGPAAGRLHTARSRNDQVATDFKLWVRSACLLAEDGLRALMRALVAKAEAHADTIMPGFTHLQAAQPITFGHHCLAYVEMAARDLNRFEAARARADESPLGAAALAGTPWPIDRNRTATELGFARPMANSLDAVSDRDFALDYLAAASATSIHLSRLAEEIVIWTTAQFGFAKLSDAFSTGSSIMPQKRNPDAAELVRAKAGRILGDLVSLTVVMKGLPLAYSKDMQEDKPPVFDAADALDLSLAAMAGMVSDLTIDEARMKASADHGFITATDLADWAVRHLNLPFREAHHLAARAVGLAAARQVGLEGLSLAELQTIEPRVDASAFDVLGVRRSVESRTSYGGTAPVRVAEQVAVWKRRLA
jgi:argininosuccinate lyase